MIQAIFFCSGLVVGLVIAVPIIMVFWHGAHKAATLKAQGDLIAAQATAMNAKKRVEASIEKLRVGYPDMTREQEEFAREQLEKTFISRYQSKPGQQAVQASRD